MTECAVWYRTLNYSVLSTLLCCSLIEETWLPYGHSWAVKYRVEKFTGGRFVTRKEIPALSKTQWRADIVRCEPGLEIIRTLKNSHVAGMITRNIPGNFLQYGILT
jgi:hypothetical protein